MKPHQDIGWLKGKYYEEGKSLTQMAKEAGCSSGAVWRWMKKYNLETRSISESLQGERGPAYGMCKYPKLRDKEWLKKLYCEEAMSCMEIADILGCSGKTVRRWVTKHNIKFREGRMTKRVKDKLTKYPKLQNKEWLEREYMKRGAMSISEELRCSKAAVLFWVRGHGIEYRHGVPQGEESPLYKGFKWGDYAGFDGPRREALRRDGCVCQRCGKLMSNYANIMRSNDVHHIVPLTDGGTHDLDNLMTLCYECHMKVHGEMKRECQQN